MWFMCDRDTLRFRSAFRGIQEKITFRLVLSKVSSSFYANPSKHKHIMKQLPHVMLSSVGRKQFLFGTGKPHSISPSPPL